MKLEAKSSIQIQKPIDEVLEGIVDPSNMTNYFISESTGRMETGNDLKWKFPEFKDWFPITEIRVIDNDSISWVWDPETKVVIKLTELPDHSTLVEVTEGEKSLNEDNMQWLLSNTAGWANFLACLKAYLEYGINLRKGAFDFMRKP